MKVNLQFPTITQRDKITVDYPTKDEISRWTKIRYNLIKVISHYANYKPQEVNGISEYPSISYSWFYNLIQKATDFLKHTYKVPISFEYNNLIFEVKDNDNNEPVTPFCYAYIGNETGNIYLTKDTNSIVFGNIVDFVSNFFSEDIDKDKLIQAIKDFHITKDFNLLRLPNFVSEDSPLFISTPDSHYKEDWIPQDNPHLFIFDTLSENIRYFQNLIKVIDFFRTSLIHYNVEVAEGEEASNIISKITVKESQPFSPICGYNGFRIFYHFEKPEWVKLFKQSFVLSCQ